MPSMREWIQCARGASNPRISACTILLFSLIVRVWPHPTSLNRGTVRLNGTTGKLTSPTFSGRAIPVDDDHIDTGTGINVYQYGPAEKVEGRQATTKSKFEVNIVNSPSQKFTNAIEYCMQRAELNWASPQTVRVIVQFKAFQDGSQLGTGRPSQVYIIRNSTLSLPMALAKAYFDLDLNSGLSGENYYDIVMNLNSQTPWYLETDAQTPRSQYDLPTVCLHEIYHGLLITGENILVEYDSNIGDYTGKYLLPKRAGRFDSFMTNHEDCAITGYLPNQTLVGRVLTSNNLYFTSSEGTRIAKLYSPRPFVQGSSLYHLSEAEYGDGETGNDLMTPAINSAYSQHNPGPVLQQIQEIMTDLELYPRAPSCANMSDPRLETNPVTQTTGNGDDRKLFSPTPGFTVQVGDAAVSGWVFVGGGLGLLCVFLVGSVLFKIMKQKPAPRRPPRVAVDVELTRDGANSDGLV